MAREVLESGQSGVVIAVDADFEPLFGDDDSIPLTHVIRTFGYSWESDVWTGQETALAVLDKVAVGASAENVIREDVSEAAKHLEASTRWPVKADALLAFNGSRGFDHQRPGRYVEVSGGGAVKVRRTELAKSIAEGRAANLQPRGPSPRRTIDSRRYLAGHFYAHYWYHVLSRLIAKNNRNFRVDSTTFHAIAISEFSRSVSGTVRSHYETELLRVGILP